jgi:hypothetical protein
MTADRWSCPCRHSDALEELYLTGGEHRRQSVQHLVQRLNGVVLHPLDGQLGVNAWYAWTQKNLGWT